MPCSTQINQNLKMKLSPGWASSLKCCPALFCCCYCCHSLFSLSHLTPSQVKLSPSHSFFVYDMRSLSGCLEVATGPFLMFQMHINEWFCFHPSCIAENVNASSSALHRWACAGGLWILGSGSPKNPSGVHTWVIAACASGELSRYECLCALRNTFLPC